MLERQRILVRRNIPKMFLSHSYTKGTSLLSTRLGFLMVKFWYTLVVGLSQELSTAEQTALEVLQDT